MRTIIFCVLILVVAVAAVAKTESSKCTPNLNFVHPNNKKVQLVELPNTRLNPAPWQFIHDIGKDIQVSSSIWTSGYWQYQDVTRMLNYLKSDPPGQRLRLLDVGANVGTFTAHALAHGIQTVSIEANSFHIELLKATIATNGWCKKSVLHTSIVMEAKKTDVLCVTKYGENSVLEGKMIDPAKLSQMSKYGHGCLETIEVTTIDDLLLPLLPLPNEYNDIGFMKVDSEGFEFNTLHGARKFLKEASPCVVFFTINLENAGVVKKPPPEEIYLFMAQNGYTAPKIFGKGDIFDVEFYPTNPPERCQRILSMK